MTIKLITPEEHKLLHDIFNNYSALTFQNKGYEYIDVSKLTEEERGKLQEVTDILSKSVKGFVKFNNFKVRKDGRPAIRLQYHWSESFTGVSYLLIDELLNGFEEVNGPITHLSTGTL